MTFRTEGPRKFLRISERQASPGPVNMLLNGLLQKAGVIPPRVAEDSQDRFVDVPRGFGWTRHLRLGEAGSVAEAMETLSATGRQGTDMRAKDFTVHAVSVDGKGRVHAHELGRRFFGWESPVVRAHRRHVRMARNDTQWGTQTDLRSSVMGRNPLRKEVAAVGAEQDAFHRINNPKGIQWYGWRAKLLARFSEGDPIRGAKHFLEPGQSRNRVFGQLKTMMLQIADDYRLDPHDKIHGPAEKLVKRLQNLQQSLLFNLFADRLSFFNTVVSSLVVANKAASRDMQADFSLRGLLTVARRVLGEKSYADYYDSRVKGKKNWRGFLARLWYVPTTQYEKAADRRMQQGNGARLAKTEAILFSTDLRDPLSKLHQSVVADEFIRALESPAPLQEVLAHAAVMKTQASRDQAANAMNNVYTSLHVDDMIASAVAAKDFIADRLNSMLPPFMRREVKPQQANANTNASTHTVNPRQALYDAIEAYGGRPMSVKDQMEAILSHAGKVLAMTALKSHERFNWTMALKHAQRFAKIEAQARTIKEQRVS